MDRAAQVTVWNKQRDFNSGNRKYNIEGEKFGMTSRNTISMWRRMVQTRLQTLQPNESAGHKQRNLEAGKRGGTEPEQEQITYIIC